MRPDIALVTDIKGVCKAGVTDQTERYPAITASEKVVTIPKKAGSGHKTPNPTKAERPTPADTAFLMVPNQGSSTTTTLSAFLTSFFLASS